MKSNPYKAFGKLFRFDYDRSIVEYIVKAETKDVESDRKWKETYGVSLYGIKEDGYMVANTIGLSQENWENQDVRDEYLASWSADLDEELKSMEADYIKCEFPMTDSDEPEEPKERSDGDKGILGLVDYLNGPWRNDSCLGYALMAMREVGLKEEDVQNVLCQMTRCFDDMSTEDAAEYYRNGEM